MPKAKEGETRPCTACGIEITFIRNKQTGNLIPAHRIRTVYVDHSDMVGHQTLETVPKADGLTWYVSHFETCRDANDFSQNRPRGT